jgi:hypothetical protein
LSPLELNSVTTGLTQLSYRKVSMQLVC